MHSAINILHVARSRFISLAKQPQSLLLLLSRRLLFLLVLWFDDLHFRFPLSLHTNFRILLVLYVHLRRALLHVKVRLWLLYINSRLRLLHGYPGGWLLDGHPRRRLLDCDPGSRLLHIYVRPLRFTTILFRCAVCLVFLLLCCAWAVLLLAGSNEKKRGDYRRDNRHPLQGVYANPSDIHKLLFWCFRDLGVTDALPSPHS